MKKIFAVLLVVCMLFSSMAVFAAEDASTEEEVILISAPAETEDEVVEEAADGEIIEEAADTEVTEEAAEEEVVIDAETMEKHAVIINGERVAIVGGMGALVEKDGVIFVPVRAILEATGYQVSWSSNDRMVMAANQANGSMFIMQLDNVLLFFTDGTTDGKLDMVAAPFMNRDEFRTYAPLNDVAQAIGYKVGFDAGANTVTLSK